MKRLLIILAMTSAAALAADQGSKATKINGWVSDSKCGAMHVGTGMSCVKKCVGEGAKPVFVDDAKKEVWTIDDPKTVTNHLGHHVAMTGTADEATKTVHITKVSMLPDQGSTKPDAMDSMH